MGFDWKDIAGRVVATFLEAVFAFVALNYTGAVTMEFVEAALFAGLAAAAALVWNIAKQWWLNRRS